MTIKYVLVASPDKISLVSFIRFIRKSIGEEYPIGEMHNLMTLESVSLYTNGFMKKYPKGIFSYYARRAVNVDPLTYIPKVLLHAAESIIWFDLYSTEAKVVKDKEDNMKVIIDDWKTYIEKMEHLKI